METRANDGANGYFLAACVAEKGYFCQPVGVRGEYASLCRFIGAACPIAFHPLR